MEQRHLVLGAGCSAHLTKPISKSTLLQAIEDYAAQPDPSSLGAFDDPAETGRTAPGLDPDVAELIPAYLENRQTDLKALVQALDSLNYERVRILGHNLKGSGGAFGFPEITAIGKLLEQSAKDKAAERIRMQIDDLANLLAGLSQAQASNLTVERT